MKKILLLLALLFPIAAHAQTAAYNSFCDQGGVSAVTSGLSSTNRLQGIIPYCTVTVYLTGTTTKATIYKDAVNTPQTNPYQTSVNGQITFWAATNQGYDVVGSGGIPPNAYPAPIPLCIDCFPSVEFVYSGITTLTTTGTSGPATLSAGVLNVPNYSGGGRTVFASQIPGIHQNTNLVSGGGTDDTSALQAVLTDASVNSTPLHLIIDGPSLITGLQYPGNTFIDCTPGNGFYLASGSNVPVIENMHPVNSGATTDNNVIFNGCIVNGNYAGQNGLNGTGPVNEVGFKAAGVNNLVVSNVTMNRTTNYGFWFYNVSGVQLLNDTYNANSVGVTGWVDGFHFNGPSSNIYGNNLTINNANDDNLALNADDGAYPGTGNVIPSYGPITDVLFDGVHVTGGYNVMRNLSNGLLNGTGTGSIIDRVVLKNVTGVLGGSLYYIDGFGDPSGTGKSNVRSVTLDTVDVQCHTYATTFYATCIYLNDTFADLKFLNMKIDMTGTTSNFLVEGNAGGGNTANGVSGRLSFDNLDLTLNPTTGTPSAPFTLAPTILDTLSITNLKAHNVDVQTAGDIVENSSTGTITNLVASNWTLTNVGQGIGNQDSIPNIYASNISTNCASPQTCYFFAQETNSTTATSLHASTVGGFTNGLYGIFGAGQNVNVYEGNGAQGVVASGAYQLGAANVTAMDISSGVSRLLSFGPSTSAYNPINLVVVHSDGSNPLDQLTVTNDGVSSPVGITSLGQPAAPGGLGTSIAVDSMTLTPELVAWGANPSTEGTLNIKGASSDGSLNITLATLTPTSFTVLPIAPASGGPDCLQISTTGAITNTGAACGSGSGSGTVTSVGLSTPSWLTVSGSPVTTSGTLAVTGTSETANYFLAAPNGSAGAMLPRAIVAADIPTLNQSTTGNAATATQATNATNVNGGTVSATTGTFSGTVAAGSTTPTTIGSTGVLLNGVPALQAQTSLNNNYSGGSGNLTGTGTNNTANGTYALYANTTGYQNTANGTYALYANTAGYQNTANGQAALYANTAGYQNTANGLQALYANTTGSYNTANGVRAGQYIADGVTANQTSSNSVYEGYQAYPLANGDTNENVIGNAAIGNGSNTTTLGNSSIVGTYYFGALHGPSARKSTFTCTAGGTIAVANTNEAATSDVIISLNTVGGTISTAPAMKTVTAGTGFTVLCGSLDTSVYNYDILN